MFIKGAFIVSGLLAVTGAGIAYTALASAVDISMILSSDTSLYQTLSNLGLKKESYYSALSTAQYAALGVSGLSIASKEMLFRYTL